MNTNFRSSPRRPAAPGRRCGLQRHVACSDEPTLPAARRASMSLLTWSRISRMRAHLASSASSAAGSWHRSPEDRLRCAHQLPGFFGGEAQERRHPAQHGLGDLPQRGLGAAAGQRLGCSGVQAVLEDVQVEAAQVFAAVQLQLGHHRVEFIHLVVRQHLGLELRLRGSARSGRSPASPVRRHGVFAPGRSRWCWPAGSAACCGCAGRRPPRGPGSCRHRRCRRSSRWRPPTGG
jgi:hypothetical protein